MKLCRLYNDAHGESHFADVELPLAEASAGDGALARILAGIPIVGTKITLIPKKYLGTDWHGVPHRQFVFHIKGSVEIEVSDGERRWFGPNHIMLVEDTAGKGHKTRDMEDTSRIILNLTVADSWRLPGTEQREPV